jgi:hypothetical protein
VGVELHVFAGSCRYLFGPKKIRRAKQNAHTNRHLYDLLGPAAALKIFIPHLWSARAAQG